MQGRKHGPTLGSMSDKLLSPLGQDAVGDNSGPPVPWYIKAPPGQMGHCLPDGGLGESPLTLGRREDVRFSLHVTSGLLPGLFNKNNMHRSTCTPRGQFSCGILPRIPE